MQLGCAIFKPNLGFQTYVPDSVYILGSAQKDVTPIDDALELLAYCNYQSKSCKVCTNTSVVCFVGVDLFYYSPLEKFECISLESPLI